MNPGIILQGIGGPSLLVPILWIIFLVLAVWTYFDANKNSSHPSFLWAIVVFLAPILGIILYFLLGRNQT